MLRVRSVIEVMQRLPGTGTDGEIDAGQNLESVIAQSEDDTKRHYLVMEDGEQVGLLHMRDLVIALVPVEASGDRRVA